MDFEHQVDDNGRQCCRGRRIGNDVLELKPADRRLSLRHDRSRAATERAQLLTVDKQVLEALQEQNELLRHIRGLLIKRLPARAPAEVGTVNQAQVKSAFVQAALGLTPAQAEVAILLAEGKTLRQIAAATGRKYSTTQTHLRHIRNKLGCSRQLDVVQTVTALNRAD